jgi:hypothetical protein
VGVDDVGDGWRASAVAPVETAAFTYQGMRTEWIFSKQTLQYLGSREVGIADGTLISQTAIKQHAIVDHAGQLPG